MTSEQQYDPQKAAHRSLDETVDRDPLETLAAEYADRYRNGERVTMEQYVQRCPELATEIRDLFPTIAAMERLHSKRTMESAMSASCAPEQLGDYRVVGEIARGGMGIVYEAEQISLGRRVAVKVLPQHALRRERDVRRFEREAQTAAKLHHSNIVPVFGVGQDEGHHYIVMQLIRGVGLDEILGEMKRLVAGGFDPNAKFVTTARSTTAKRSAVGLLETELRRDTTVLNCNGETLASDGQGGASTDGGVPDTPRPDARQIQANVGSEYYKNVARIGLQAAQALHYAHRHGTLHRDVKPGNLLLDEEGCVWMADFGLAKAVENDSVTCSGDVVGTLAYVAPERFQGETTERSDIYSLGLTLHEMLTFRRAFDGKDRVAIVNQVANERLSSPRKWNPAVPRDLETIAQKAASYEPADRYQSAGDMARDLEAFLEDRPIHARRLSRVEHAVRWCRRNRAMAALAASVIFLLATVFGVTVAGYFHSDQQRQGAEATATLAVSALDEIYTLFAARQLNIPAAGGGAEPDQEQELLLGNTQLPLSKDVALLLENLLRFYDDLSKQAKDSGVVAVKSIAANRRVGDIRRRLGHYDEAQTSYEEAIERIERLERELRDTEAVRLESARIRNGLGIVLQEGRHTKESIRAHRDAIQLMDHSAATENEQFELASSLYLLHVAQQQDQRGKRSDGDSAPLERAKAILNALQARHPNVPGYRFLLARCLMANKSGCGKDGGLNTCQATAIKILESLVDQAPDNPDYQYELGEAYCSIEWDEFRKHRDQRNVQQLLQSEQRLRRGIQVTANLATQNPNIPQYNEVTKGLHHLLAISLRQQGRLPEAAVEYVRAIEKQRLVVKQAHEPHRHAYWLSHLELRYGLLLRDLGQFQEAKDLLAVTASDLEQLAEQPEIKTSDHYHGHAQNALAEIHTALDEVENRLRDSMLDKPRLPSTEQRDP